MSSTFSCLSDSVWKMHGGIKFEGEKKEKVGGIKCEHEKTFGNYLLLLIIII